MLDYHLYARDESFDLLTGTLPHALSGLFIDQLTRARHLLRNRTTQEIDAAIDDLDRLLRAADRPYYDDVDLELVERAFVPINRFKALKTYMNDKESRKQSEIADETWPEYFAVFVLALIGETLFEHKQRDIALQFDDRIPVESKPNTYSNKYMCENAIEAMEAICYAEQMPGRGVDAQQARKHARKGGRRRTSRYLQLDDRIKTILAEKYPDTTNTKEIARGLVTDLAEDELAVLQSTDRVEALAIRVRKLRKITKVAP